MDEKEKLTSFLKEATDRQKRTFLYALVCAMDTLENVTQKNNEKNKIEKAQQNLNYFFSSALLEQIVYMLERNRAKRVETCLHLRMEIIRRNFLEKKAEHHRPHIDMGGRDKT